MTDPDLEPRVHALEIGHEVQGEILTEIQAELIEAARLIESVEHLGDGAGALAGALLVVEAQQQELTQLGQEIKEVEEKSATSEEVEEKVAEETERTKKARRRQAAIIAATGALVTVALGGMLAYTINADYHACKQRKVRVDIQVALYNDLASTTSSEIVSERILRGARDLERTKVNCETLYPIHWGNDAPS